MKKHLPTAEKLPQPLGPRRPLGDRRARSGAQLRIVEKGPEPDRMRQLQLAGIARHYLLERRRREARLPAQLFSDPVWDSMLDLFASRIEGKKVSVSDACIAANVPATTALRWFAKMEECGLIVRQQDPNDLRRAYVELTETAAEEVEAWLHQTFVEFVCPIAR